MAQTFPGTGFSARKIPLFGDWVYNAGRLNQMWATPCSPTPAIWALGFWHATPWLVWSLFGFDCIDAAYDANRPGRHRTRRRIRVRGGKGIRGHPPVPGWGWRVFNLGDLAQKVGWYFAIIDAGIDFAVHWSTMARQYSGCDALGEPYAKLYVPVKTIALNSSGAWTNFNFTGADTNIFPASGNHIVVPPGYSWGSQFHIVDKPYPPSPGATQFDCRVIDAAGIRQQQSNGDTTADREHSNTSIVRGNEFHLGGASLFFQFRSQGGHADLEGSFWTVSGFKSSGLGPFGCGSLERKANPITADLWEFWENAPTWTY